MRIHTRMLLSLVLIAACLGAGALGAPLTSAQAVAEPAPLFRAAQDRGFEPDPAARRRGVVRSRAVFVDTALVDASAPGSRLTLNPFADVSLVAIAVEVGQSRSGARRWIGRIRGDQSSRVVLSSADGIVAGLITTQDSTYHLRYRRDGLHAVDSLDLTQLPDESRLIEPAAAPESPMLAMSDRVGNDKADRFDVLVVYTEAAEKAAGGASGFDRQIDVAETNTNKALQKSKAKPRIRVVDSIKVDYTESGDLSQDLKRLKSKSDRHMDIVHEMRDLYGADQVQLIVAENADSCGAAFTMTKVDRLANVSAFAVSAWDCAIPNHTFAHELGHNWGFNHARDDEPTGRGAFDYSRGYKDPGGAFRTVMSYAPDPGARMPRLVSPPARVLEPQGENQRHSGRCPGGGAGRQRPHDQQQQGA